MSDLLATNDYGPKKRGCRYILVVIDNFTIYIWTISLKIKIAQTKTKAFAYYSGRTKTKLIETDNGREFINKIFTKFPQG